MVYTACCFIVRMPRRIASCASRRAPCVLGAPAGARADVPLFEKSAGKIKVNPLAAWTPKDIADYMDTHNLPRHPLVAKGYPSIGCMPCTTRVGDHEDARSGRWRDASKTECGIHFTPDGPLRSKTAAK